LPSGQYSFAVESYSNDALLSVTPVQTYTEVIEARVENGQTLLVLAGGGEVLASEITGLRAADGPSGQ
jgi:flagellar basal-body rod modification protein FlgD